MSEPKSKDTKSPAVHPIAGRQAGERVRSRILEEQIQQAIADGHRRIEVQAFGQHGIGGRLWRAGDDPVQIRVTGHSGQRLGSMGFPNTVIEVLGPVSDDVGWLNAGAEIIVHGNASNGAANGMAQGRVCVAGNIGARGMTMTKHNPRFEPPELWVLGSVGDYFAEFMAGGIAVVCGLEAQDPENVLGYRPLVGMVGGKVFFRGPHAGFSQTDARLAPIGDADWDWLQAGLKTFLKKIGRLEMQRTLSERASWQLLVARRPSEKAGRSVRAVAAFHREVWDAELGQGGLIGDLSASTAAPSPSSPPGRCGGSSRSGRTRPTPPRAKPAARPASPCSAAGSSCAKAGWTRRSTWRWPTPPSRRRSAATSARTCACSPAPGRSAAWRRWTRPGSARPASGPASRSCPRSAASASRSSAAVRRGSRSPGSCASRATRPRCTSWPAASAESSRASSPTAASRAR